MEIYKFIKLPDIITLVSVIFAMLSIFFSLQRDFVLASLLILFSVAADFLDGTVARFIKRKGDFGKQMDSLADVIAFGVAPALFGYMLLLHTTFNKIILIFFVCAGLLRLARFNISPPSDYFEGIPITSAGIIIPLSYLLNIPINLLVYIYLVLGILMISSFKVRKFKATKQKKRT